MIKEKLKVSIVVLDLKEYKLENFLSICFLFCFVLNIKATILEWEVNMQLLIC